MWVISGLLSAFFLGMYDVSRKIALKDNAVITVLFLASATGALIFAPVVVLSYFNIIDPGSIIYIPVIDVKTHIMFFLKSLIVGGSWFFAYNAISMLPLTIVTPIRSTGPVWTLMGALLIYSEKFTLYQWLGIIIVLLFFYIFSLAGRKEGINFVKNKGILYIVIATVLGSVSSLYDKFLIGNYNKMAVQAWFSMYMVVVFVPMLLFLWYPKRKKLQPFKWNFYIHLIGIVLVITDFFYFLAISQEGSLIAVISVLRRSSVVIAFSFGAVFMKEANIKHKSFALFGILTGVILLILGSV